MKNPLGGLHLRSWQEFKQNLIFELKIAKLEWKALLFGIVWQYIHSVLHNLAYWMQTKLSLEQRAPLYDQGFILLGELSESNAHISEYLVFVGIFGPSILLFASVLILRQSENSRPRIFLLIVKRVLLQTAICLMLRCATFLVTSLPGPAPHCRPMYNQTCMDSHPNDPTAPYICEITNPYFDPPMTVGKVFSHIDALNGCGDLMFSSHTTYTVSMILAVWKYYRNVPVLIVMLLMQVAIAFLIVAGRKHYSSDVIAALYVVPMVWFMQEAFHFDLNHQDAVVSAETIKSTYNLSMPQPDESSDYGTIPNESSDYAGGSTPLP